MLGILGRSPDLVGGVLVPLARPGRCPLDLLLSDDNVVGGDCLSTKELRVEEDLLIWGWSSLPPSLLDVLPDEPLVSVVLNEFLERRRRSRRSLRKEGIAAGCERRGGLVSYRIVEWQKR